MAIQAYSLSKEGYKQLSANFRVREFRCRDGSDPVFVDEELVSILQQDPGALWQGPDHHQRLPHPAPQ